MKWARGVVIAAAGAVALIVLAGLPLYVFPPADEVTRSDAILVLGPPMDERLSLAERLRDEGIADSIVVSTQPSGGQTAADLEICDEPGVTCAVSDPYATRGEVLLAPAGFSASVIVITSTPHVSRTRYIFSKCYTGEFVVVGVDTPLSFAEWAQQYAYQSAAFVKALFEPCP